MSVDQSLDTALADIKAQAKQGLQKILEQNQQQWEAKLQAKQQALLEHINPECVKLNVGGKKFITSMAVLTKAKGSKLERMVTGKYPMILDQKKRIFIDRNGQYFSYVLDCLRDGKIEIPSDPVLSRRVNAELEFFELLGAKFENPENQSEIKREGSYVWKLSDKGSFKPSQDKTQLEAFAGLAIILGDKELTSGTHEWRFLLENKQASGVDDSIENLATFGIIQKDLSATLEEEEYFELTNGFSTDGEVFMGANPDSNSDSIIEMSKPIPFGNEIKLTLSFKEATLKLECKKLELETLSKIKNISGQAFYPYFQLIGVNAKLSLLETIQKAE